MILQLLAGAAVLGGVYEYTQDGKVQVHKGVTVDGIPVAAAIPVVKAVSALQANPSLFNPGPKPPGYTPPVVPIAFPGSGTLNLSPIVITPTGGSNVAVLTDTDAQTALNTLGVANPPLLVDGSIGPASQAALRIFQITTGIPATGQADPATKAALSVALATIGSPSASVGRSPQVLAATVQSAAATVPIVSNRDVQHALNVLGATPQLTEDGVLGPLSVAAIKAFQMVHGMLVDGIAGPMTKTALAMALHNPVGPPAIMAGESYDAYARTRNAMRQIEHHNYHDNSRPLYWTPEDDDTDPPGFLNESELGVRFSQGRQKMMREDGSGLEFGSDTDFGVSVQGGAMGGVSNTVQHYVAPPPAPVTHAVVSPPAPARVAPPSSYVSPPAPPTRYVAPPAPPSSYVSPPAPPTRYVAPPAPPSSYVSPPAPPTGYVSPPAPPTGYVSPPAPPTGYVSPPPPPTSSTGVTGIVSPQQLQAILAAKATLAGQSNPNAWGPTTPGQRFPFQNPNLGMTPWQRHERHEQWLANQQANPPMNQQAQNLGGGAAPLTQSYVMDPSMQAAAVASAPDPSGASMVVSASPDVPSDQTTDPMLDQAIADSDNADAQSGAIDPTSGASQSILDAGADFGYSSGRVGDFRHMKGTFGMGAEFGASHGHSGGKKSGTSHRHRHSSQQQSQSSQDSGGGGGDSGGSGGGGGGAPDSYDDDMGAEFGGGMVSASQLASLAASNVAAQQSATTTPAGTVPQGSGHHRHHHHHFLSNQGSSTGSYSSQMMAPPPPPPTPYDDSSSYGCDEFGAVAHTPANAAFFAASAQNAALGMGRGQSVNAPPPVRPFQGMVTNAYGRPFPYQGPQSPGMSSGGGHRRQWQAQQELSQAMADQSAMQYAQQGMADQGYLPGSYDDSDDDSGDYDVSGDFGGPTKAGKQHESDNLARSRTTVRS